ncbi:MAG TPA: gamma-glutamyltransferase, partial [Candidatus Saccharimonadales bacterium]|nr:gamma-glutamyltransferase [Candidatus Saccharimonadales bacterium]
MLRKLSENPTLRSKLPRATARLYIATAMAALILMTNCQPVAQDKSGTSPVKPAPVKPGRSVVRSQHAMVASSQPLASQVGLEVLKRGGNAVDAAIAMAAMLNVTEPMMTGIGGDAFMLVYWSKTKELKGLNASGRAPTALSLDYFAKTKTTQMPEFGMESITVPGAFDGWVTLLEKYGT